MPLPLDIAIPVLGIVLMLFYFVGKSVSQEEQIEKLKQEIKKLKEKDEHRTDDCNEYSYWSDNRFTD